jgi:Domain of unknown function (DUF4704)
MLRCCAHTCALRILQGSAVNCEELQRCDGIGMLLSLLTAAPSTLLLLAREGPELVTAMYELWHAVADLTVTVATVTDAAVTDKGEPHKHCLAAVQVMQLLLANFELWKHCSAAVQVAAAVQLRDAVKANSTAVAAVLSVSAVLSAASMYAEDSSSSTTAAKHSHSGSVDSTTSSSANSRTGAGCSKDSSSIISESACSADEKRSVRCYLLEAVLLLLLPTASTSSSDGVAALLRYAVSRDQQPEHTAEVRSAP